MKQIREVRVKDLIIYFWLQIGVLAVFWTAFGVIAGLKLLPVSIWIELIAVIALTYMPFRCFLIGCVLMYKAYAPMSIRQECRFHPTCSTYMILSIQKYGIIVGVTKGIRRIIRCKPPNGGEDWP